MASNKYQCLRGMRDLPPNESFKMEYIASTMKRVAIQYGYMPIDFPILESANLFQKSLGVETDIIGQEMYTFQDKDKSSSLLALRPEGTAGCLRSVLANGLIQRQKQKLFYHGPMFRRERPQKGRFRQFSHFGVEVYGYPSGGIDAELILMSQKMWAILGLKNLNLHINYLGSIESRKAYHHKLQTYFLDHQNQLLSDEIKRAENNPLRLLDSKNPEISDLIDQAPPIKSCLSTEEKEKFEQICQLLTAHNIDYVESNRLVRGLDYYSDFIFEWISDDLGSQSTILGGGRYDPLVKNMGHDIPAIGFAAGIDRIEAILAHQAPRLTKVTIAFESQDLWLEHHLKLERMRNDNVVTHIDPLPGKFKSKNNQASQNDSDYLLYISEEGLKLLSFDERPLQTISFDHFIQWYQQL